MSVNLWIGIGNLTRDPELIYTSTGIACCTFSIACNERYKSNDERKEHVEYINIVAWRKLAEICGEYLSKGKQVYVCGKLRTETWKDKDGNQRSGTKIIINEMQMLGSPGKKEEKYPVPKERQKEDLDVPF